MNEDHTPDPEFVSHLEWELNSTMRRQGSLNGASGATRRVRLRLGTTLALVVVSMFVGGAGTHAVTHSIDEQAAALYVSRGAALLEIAQTRLEHFAQELAKTNALVEQGVVTPWESMQVDIQFLHAEAETEIRKLELAETLITGKEPNDALSAPLAGGRDFLAERMAAQRPPLQRRLDLATEQVRRYQELSEAGMVGGGELKAAQTEVAAAEGELAGLEKRITLRASFLAEELSAAEAELQGMRFAAIAARETAVRQVEVLAEQHNRLMHLAEQGSVTGSEVRAVETELETVEAHVELADLELRILELLIEDAPEK